jgi:hypothetical protein
MPGAAPAKPAMVVEKKAEEAKDEAAKDKAMITAVEKSPAP